MNDSCCYSEGVSEEGGHQQEGVVSAPDQDAFPYYIEETYDHTTDEITWGNL